MDSGQANDLGVDTSSTMNDMRQMLRFLAILFWLVAAPALADSRFNFSIDFPVDSGLPTGTLFHVGDTAGAGFAYANNTHRTTNPRVVTFFAKGNAGVKVTDLGKPFADSVTFGLVSMKDELLAVAYSPGFLRPRQYDKPSRTWRDVSMPGWKDGVTNLGGFQVVNNRPLYLYTDAPNLYFDGNAITGDSRFVGKKAYGLLYAVGKLYLFFQADGPDFMYACDWMPGKDAVSNCIEASFGINVWLYSFFPVAGGAGITDTLGNVWRLSSSGALTTYRQADSASYQIYSALLFQGQWWAGHYPSGSLVRWPDLTAVDPAIGKQPCSDSAAREAQSLGIHMGKIVAGVWPWGEVWTGSPGNSWELLTRVFQNPANVCGAAPFIAQAVAAGAEMNALGQRIFGIANWDTGIAVSATMKNPYYATALDRLTAPERAPYGSVFLIEQDYELSCTIPGSGAMELTFVLTSTTMDIRKDGTVLCSRLIDGTTLQNLTSPAIIGDGPWGSFTGKIKANAILH